MSVDQALETIRNRVDQFGVSEPDIRRQGENRILIQLPGITDTQRAKDLIGRTALLEFKLVDEAHDLNSALQGNVPAGSEILYKFDEDRSTHKPARPLSAEERHSAHRRVANGRPESSTRLPIRRALRFDRVRPQGRFGRSSATARTSTSVWPSCSTTRSTPPRRSRSASRAVRPHPAASP
jgi:preprotein translocase subunit SecD